jgi:uncharacterized protein YggU (UPF0235/DUF167 family)
MRNLFRKFNLHEGKRGSAITIHVVTGAREKRFIKVLEDGTLILEMDVRDVSGKTNQILVKYLAGLLNVLTDEIEVVAGKDGPDKIVSILNQDTHTLHHTLMKLIQQ